MSQRWPAGVKVLVVFFAFGATACAVTVAALLTPGGTLDIVWRLNPEAHLGFQKIGTALSVLFMFVVGTACAWGGSRTGAAEAMGTTAGDRDPDGESGW
jgi:hypothetical protein